MSPRWDDINARVRGLARHLATPAVLEDLVDTPDLLAFGKAARETGLLAPEAATRSPLDLELALRRAAAGQFRIVLRWLGPREALLRVLVDDEDRRSVRAIVRGAASGAPAEARLAGLVPTPNLPERLLEELARQPRPGDVAALLAAWQHPFGSAALEAASGEHPDLFRFELEVDRAFAVRAVAGARRGGIVLREFVADTIDYLNLMAALVLAGSESEQPPERAFLEGGRRLARARFLDGAGAGSPAAAAELLGATFGGEERTIIRRDAHDLGALERELLARRIARLRVLVRHDPLGPAPILAYLLRLRAQAINLRLLLWGAALSAPVAARRERLVRAS